MCKLHRKLNFSNIFRLGSIYTWVPAFFGRVKIILLYYVKNLALTTYAKTRSICVYMN